MSDSNNKRRRPSRPRVQPGSAPDASKPRRRRQRLPVRARVAFDDSLPPNEHHPLAQSTPEARAANRVRLIAAILARMAQTDLARSSPLT